MSPTRCADCNTNERRIGCRCWVCYLQRLGRDYGFSSYKWWDDRFDIMQAALRGRYEMLAMGQEQGDVWKTFLFIWPHRKGVVRPDWVHSERGAKQKADMLRIVANLDRKARKEYGQSKTQE